MLFYIFLFFQVKTDLATDLHLSRTQLGWLDTALLLPYATIQVRNQALLHLFIVLVWVNLLGIKGDFEPWKALASHIWKLHEYLHPILKQEIWWHMLNSSSVLWGGGKECIEFHLDGRGSGKLPVPVRCQIIIPVSAHTPQKRPILVSRTQCYLVPLLVTCFNVQTPVQTYILTHYTGWIKKSAKVTRAPFCKILNIFWKLTGWYENYRIVSNKRSPSNKRPPNLFSNKTR